MTPSLDILVKRSPLLLILAAIMLGYLYSYAVGCQGMPQTLGYLASIALLAWILWPARDVTIRRPAESDRGAEPPGIWLPKTPTSRPPGTNEMLVFAAVVGLGVFLRFWSWDSVPQGLWIDEILATANALRVLDGHPAHLLGTLPMNPERPGWVHTFNLYTYAVVLNVKLFGSGHFGIKMLSILPGCITLVAFYWLLRETQGPRLAVIGTLILSMSRWHLTHSRVDWDVTFMLALGVLALASLVRGLKGNRPHWIGLGGVLLGLSQFSYVGSRLLAAGVFGWLAVLTLLGRKGQPRFRSRTASGLAICLLAFLVASAPVWLFTLRTNPAAATSRIRQVSVVDFGRFSVDLETLEARLRRHFEALVSRGPKNARANIPGAPLLPPLTAALAGAGALVHLALRRGIAHPMTWSLFVFGILNGALTRGDEVAPQRIVIVLPVLCLWAAHALELIRVLLLRLGASIRERVRAAGGKALPQVVTAMIAAAIFYPGLRDSYDYFAVFGESEANRRAMGNGMEVLIARAAGDLLGTHEIWIDGHLRLNPLPMHVLFWHPRRVLHGRTVGGLDDPPYHRIELSGAAPLLPPFEIDRPVALVSMPGRSRALSRTFGPLESREFQNWAGTRPLFSIYFLESAELKKRSAAWRRSAERASTPPREREMTPERSSLPTAGQGLQGIYYEGIVWRAAAPELAPEAIAETRVLRRQLDPNIDFVWRYGAKPAARFSVEWKGFLRVDESTTYTLATESDDGSAVYVDGRRIVDNWGKHPRRRREGTVFLEAGLHPITIRYDDQGGGARMRLLWRRQDQRLSVVPGRNLAPTR